MADVVVGIHQPNFLPWLGFFHKLATCDVFVLLDSVQFSRGSRTNRVQVLAGDRPIWLTVPVRRPEHGEPLIADALIDDSKPWRRKALRTLEVSYGGLPGFEATHELISEVLGNDTDRLAVLNEAAIVRLAAALSLPSPSLVRASDLGVEGAGSELLARLVEAAGGTVYLSGAGAGGYHEQEPFAERGIEVRFQRFEHADYPQRSPERVHGLSIVDAMMSVGPDAAARLITMHEHSPT
jgi:WbqC-like protein family